MATSSQRSILHILRPADSLADAAPAGSPQQQQQPIQPQQMQQPAFVPVPVPLPLYPMPYPMGMPFPIPPAPLQMPQAPATASPSVSGGKSILNMIRSPAPGTLSTPSSGAGVQPQQQQVPSTPTPAPRASTKTLTAASDSGSPYVTYQQNTGAPQTAAITEADMFLRSLQKSKPVVSAASTPSLSADLLVAGGVQSEAATTGKSDKKKSKKKSKQMKADSDFVDQVPSPEQLNFEVLQRHDPEISEVLVKSAHAVLYKFVSDTNAWEKLSCQGALFIYSRGPRTVLDEGFIPVAGTQIESAGPVSHALCILNRQSLKNFYLRLEDVTDVERLDEFVMLRSPYGAVEPWELSYEDPNAPKQPDVWGLWIYDKDDREKVEELCRAYAFQSRVEVGEQSVLESRLQGLELRADAQPQQAANNGEVLNLLFKKAVDRFVSVNGEDDEFPSVRRKKRR